MVLSSCVRVEDILCKCAIRIRPSDMHVTINFTNNNLVALFKDICIFVNISYFI